MADLQPQTAFAAGGFGASGETAPFALAEAAPGVFVASVVTGVSGTLPELQVFLDVLEEGTWTQVAALTEQSTAGVESASAQAPPDASGTYRLRWTVSGAGAEFFGRAFAVGNA